MLYHFLNFFKICHYFSLLFFESLFFYLIPVRLKQAILLLYQQFYLCLNIFCLFHFLIHFNASSLFLNFLQKKYFLSEVFLNR